MNLLRITCDGNIDDMKFDEFIEFDAKKLQSQGFDPRISSVEGQCANHYTTEPTVIAIIFKSMLLSVNSLTVPVKGKTRLRQRDLNLDLL